MKNFATKSIISFFTVLLVSASVALAKSTPPTRVAENQPPETKTNVVKVCVALPKVELAEGSSPEAAVQLRGAFAQLLKSPTVEAVEMESDLSPAVLAAAKEKGCKFVLQTALTQKKGNNFGNIFGSLSTILENAMPASGKSGGKTVADQIASKAIKTAANLFSKVKSKDKITLEYNLVSASENAKAAGQTMTAKIKSDGEDVLSPMIEKIAEDVRQTAAK